MMDYIKSFWQTEEEYKAVLRSREIYNQIFMKFNSWTSPGEYGLCSKPNCSGWVFFRSSFYWEACSHRKRRGLEARKKDMVARDIKRAEDRLFDWVADRERRKRERALKQMDVLGERRGSSTCTKCGKTH